MKLNNKIFKNLNILAIKRVRGVAYVRSCYVTIDRLRANNYSITMLLLYRGG